MSGNTQTSSTKSIDTTPGWAEIHTHKIKAEQEGLFVNKVIIDFVIFSLVFLLSVLLLHVRVYVSYIYIHIYIYIRPSSVPIMCLIPSRRRLLCTSFIDATRSRSSSSTSVKSSNVSTPTSICSGIR